MLIDTSFFTKGPRHIQNAALGTTRMVNSNTTEVNSAIEYYISYWQEDFLISMLGKDLGTTVNGYLVDLDGGNQEQNDSYDTLCEELKESFADYVFFKILRDNNSQATMTGLVRLKCANEYIAPIQRQVSTWNGMVERNSQFVEWAQSEECTVTGISVDSNMLTKINIFNL